MAQFARPYSDITATGWNASGSGDLNEFINEVTPDNAATYIFTSANNTPAEFGLTTITDPVSSSGHIIRVTSYGSPVSVNYTFYLMQGATQIASSTQLASGGSFGTNTYTLSGAEADNITDYSNLSIKIEALSAVFGSRFLLITQAEFEVPDVAATSDIDASLSFEVTQSSELKGDGETSATSSLIVSQSSTIKGTGNVSGLLDMVISNSATLKGQANSSLY